MRQPVPKHITLAKTVLAIGLSVNSLGVSVAQPVSAQSNGSNPSSYSVCQPPQTGEYLLLVVSPTSESQTQVQKVLPANTSSTVCRYLDDVVTRVNGFSTLAAANSWAQYLNEVVGLSAFVAKATTTSPATNSSAAPTTPIANSTSLAYNPRPLGEGYAVLVNHFNQPEVATQVQQLLNRDIGLVVYGQRPYLLAVYTANQQDANSVLQTLTDRGFRAMVVDSRRVILLRSTVASQRSAIEGRSSPN